MVLEREVGRIGKSVFSSSIEPTKSKSFLATTPGLVLACLASCFLWGSAFPCVKLGYELYAIDSTDLASILTFAGTRFVIAGLMVAVGMSIVKRRPFVPAPRDVPPVITLAAFQTVLQYVLFYVGLANCMGVTSSILEASNSFLCVLLAALVFRFERLTARKVIGCVIGFGGVLLVNLWGGRGGLSFTLMGEGMVLASTVAAATSSNLAKHFSADHDPVLLSGWQFVAGGAFMLVLGLAFGGHIAPADTANPAPAILLLAYLGFIPEDRHKTGLVLDFTVEENLIIKEYMKDPYAKRGILQYREIGRHADEMIRKYIKN